jgi:hypothetical protein
MKLDGKLFLFGLPFVAILMIALIQTIYGGLAPAPPIAIPDRTAQAPIPPRLRTPQPTVLAPSAEPSPVPPGGTPITPIDGIVPQFSDERLNDTLLPTELIPIPELRPND